MCFIFLLCTLMTNETASLFFFWMREFCLQSENIVHLHAWIHLSVFLTNRRQDRLQRSEMFSWNKIINALKRSRRNINPFATFKPAGWKCYKTFGSYVSVRSSRFEARGKFGEDERCIRVASSNSYASFVHSKLPACFISWWTHADIWTSC